MSTSHPPTAAPDELVTSHALVQPLLDERLLSEAACEKFAGILDPFLRDLRDHSHPKYWEERVRKWWDFDEVVPMNAANLCPEARPIVEAANVLRVEYNRDVSQQGRTVDGEPGRHIVSLRLARAEVARGLGLPSPSDRAHVALLRNTSEANNLLSNGFRHWNPDGQDRVVVWRENHPTNRAAWRLRARDGRRTSGQAPLFQVIEVSLPREADAATIANTFLEYLEVFGPRLRFISLTQVSNGNGMRIPDAALDRIWSAVEGRAHCHLHVDGAMSWGALPIDLSRPRFHSICASAHKWFLGPKETGFLYMDPSRVPNFMPQSFAYDYKIEVPDWSRLGSTAMERFELIGQRDDVNLIHLASVQRMWDAIGFERAVARISRLAGLLWHGLVTVGRWTPVTPRRSDNRWAILRFEAGRPAGKRSLYRYLHDHGIAASASNLRPDEEASPTETIRLCPTIYNLESDVTKAIEVMNTWRRLT